MKGIENIINRIAIDAKKEASEIVARASAEASAIRVRYREIAEKEAQAIIEKGSSQAEEKTKRICRAAQFEGKKKILAAKQEMIDSALDNAISVLRSREGGEYEELLADILLSATVTGNEEVLFSNEDREKHGKAVIELANKKLSASKKLRGEGFRLSDRIADIEGGAILKAGKVEIDASFSSIIKQKRDELASEIANILFN